MPRSVSGGPATPVCLVNSDTPEAANQSAMIQLKRAINVQSVTMADNAAISGTIDMRFMAGGMVLIPSGWIAANMGFKVAAAPGDTFIILREDDGTPVQISGIVVGTAYWYMLPTKTFGAHFIQLWSKSTVEDTVTDTNQTGGPLTFQLMLKG